MTDADPWAIEPGEFGPDAVPAGTSMAGRDGAAVLAAVERFLSRFVVYPGEAERVAHVLWIAHAWLIDRWDSTPRIAFLSPEPGSGKSRALEVTEPLVPEPVHAVNVSPAYLFRKVGNVEAGPPTILFDEIDTVFGPKAKDNEDLRGLLNAGHRKGAIAGRCVVRGKEVHTEELPAYAAVALAGLDDLPDTLMSRSVVVRMKRRAPGEKVEPWRLRTCKAAADELRDELRTWARSVASQAGTEWPDMPPGVEDRDADVWEALLAVADLAGGEWPKRARTAAVAMVTKAQAKPPSMGVLLLRDLRTVFTEGGQDRLPTEAIIAALVALEDSPWADLRGKPLDARGLSRRLNRYGLGPRPLRGPAGVFKGYDRADLADAWTRYLPEEPHPRSDNTVTTVTRLPATALRNRVTEVTETDPHGREQSHACTVCGEPLAGVIVAEGGTTHPTCDCEGGAL